MIKDVQSQLLHYLLHILRPPHFDDMIKTRDARLHYFVLIVVLLSSSVALALYELAFWSHGAVFTVVLGFSAVAYVTLMYLLSRGYIKLVSYAVCIAIWVSLAILSLPNGGLYDRLFTYLLLPIALAGLLINGWAGFTFAIFSSALGLIQVLVFESQPAIMTTWASKTLIFLIMALLVGLSKHNANMTLKKLLELNQTLTQEVSRHRKTTAALQASEQRYRLLLEHLPTAVFVIDQQTLRVIYVNQMALDLLHLNHPEQAVGKLVTTFATAQYLEAMISDLQRVSTIAFSHSSTLHLGLGNGQSLPVETTAIAITYDGQPAILSVYNDLTLRQQIEAKSMAAERARAELEQERRLHEQDRHYFERLNRLKDDLLNSTTHDLKNPLTGIFLGLESLRLYLPDPDQRVQGVLRRLRHSTTHMQQMINQLLDKAVLETGRSLERKPVELEKFLFGLKEDVEFQVTDREIQFVFQSATATVQFDPERMRQVLNNLLSNAIKYTPAGGQIALRARVNAADLIIEVQDDGIGIPPDAIPRLFDEFFRVDHPEHRAVEGTGLGLSIVKSIIDQHQGAIHVESNEGQGTTFRVVLPNAVIAAAESASAVAGQLV